MKAGGIKPFLPSFLSAGRGAALETMTASRVPEEEAGTCL
jgi:hypothetical protein